jgi:RNA polymerase sigma factor (sigma-70 family)
MEKVVLEGWRGKALAVGVVLTFVGAIVASIASGTPSKLPGIALGWSVLLHIERAAAIASAVAVAAVVILQFWRGQLPTSLPLGVGWASTGGAVDRDAREQILRVERESKTAFDELRRGFERLATGEHIASSDIEAVQEAAKRWEDAINVAERKDEVANAITELPERLRLIVALYDYEHLTQHEIAQMLGVSQPRVSQLHSEAISRLRGRLGRDPFGDDDAKPADEES